MRKLILLSISCLLITGSGFAEVDPATKTKLTTLITEQKLDEAREIANNELVNNPNDNDVVRKRGLVHFMQGNYKSAAEDFSNYLATKPESAKAYLYRGLAYIAMGNEDNGQEDIKKALSINPSLASTVNELKPKIVAATKKISKEVPVSTKKGHPIKTKKGPVGYKAK